MSAKKEELSDIMRVAPKRKLTEIDKQLVLITIEKSRIKRERSMAIFDKGILIFFGFVIVAYMNNIHKFVPTAYINTLFICALLVLIFSIASYQSVIIKEQRALDNLLDNFLK